MEGRECVLLDSVPVCQVLFVGMFFLFIFYMFICLISFFKGSSEKHNSFLLLILKCLYRFEGFSNILFNTKTGLVTKKHLKFYFLCNFQSKRSPFYSMDAEKSYDKFSRARLS